MLVRSNTLEAFSLLGRAKTDIHRLLYFHLQCTPDNHLIFSLYCIILLHFSSVAALVCLKGLHALLIDFSHAVESVTGGTVLIVVSGAFFPCGDFTVSKLSPQGACTSNEGLPITPVHIFLFSLDPLLTVLSSSLAFIFSNLIQALHFPRVCPSSTLWVYLSHLTCSQISKMMLSGFLKSWVAFPENIMSHGFTMTSMLCILNSNLALSQLANQQYLVHLIIDTLLKLQIFAVFYLVTVRICCFSLFLQSKHCWTAWLAQQPIGFVYLGLVSMT